MMQDNQNIAVENAQSPLISVRNLQKSFGDLQVLKGIDLIIYKGEVVSIVGPSGAGKTTLIKNGIIHFFFRITVNNLYGVNKCSYRKIINVIVYTEIFSTRFHGIYKHGYCIGIFLAVKVCGNIVFCNGKCVTDMNPSVIC